jgi:hypothetical protein
MVVFAVSPVKAVSHMRRERRFSLAVVAVQRIQPLVLTSRQSLM